MLLRDRDSDAPKLSLLLCESLFAVYLSILIHALTFYETNVLYRLSVHTFSEKMWSTLFGGGVKQIVRPRVISTSESKYAYRKLYCMSRAYKKSNMAWIFSPAFLLLFLVPPHWIE